MFIGHVAAITTVSSFLAMRAILGWLLVARAYWIDRRRVLREPGSAYGAS